VLIPTAKLKFKVDVGWNAEAKGYLCRALVVPNYDSGTEMWNAWAKNLDRITPGIGHTMREAIDVLKENIRSYLTTLIGGRENVKIPWTELTGYAPHGSKVVWCLVKGAPGPDGKLEEEVAAEAAAIEKENAPVDKPMVKQRKTKNARP